MTNWTKLVQDQTATAIQIGRPANIIKALRALEYTNGVVTTVSDSEMLDGMSVVGLNGFDCEMASGASPAGIKKLLNEGIIKKDDREYSSTGANLSAIFVAFALQYVFGVIHQKLV